MNMGAFKLTKAFCGLIAFILIVFSIGCGGGGGGTVGPAPTGTYDNAPTAGSLATAQQLYTYSSSAANLVMTVPVISGQVATFAMLVTNSSTFMQSVSLEPATAFAASIKEQIEGPFMVSASVASYEDYDLARMYEIKGRLEEKLRRDNLQALRNAAGNLRASLRASDHSGENVGDTVQISLVGDNLGWSYITRNCKLERKTAHCKIFVDQESFEGLSAVNGLYRVTASDLDHFAKEFEDYIYPLMVTNYGNVYDIDQDGRLSILISPVYAKIGFAGLFNSIDMTPGATTNSNQRDMIGVWSPSSSKWSGEYWRAATRETIAHEMQHAINYSAKVYPGGIVKTGVGNYDSLLEDMWLDESLSVGAEARYRIRRGENSETSSYGGSIVIDSVANDSRFNEWAKRPWSVKMDSFSYSTNAFEHYGQKGLFNYYLFERFGASKIRELVQTTRTGVDNFNNVFGDGKFAELVKDWRFAALNEGLRTANAININSVDSKYRYQEALKLTNAYQAVQYDARFPIEVSVAAGGSAYYVIKQPANTLGSEYQFTIKSTEGRSVEVHMMRLP